MVGGHLVKCKRFLLRVVVQHVRLPSATLAFHVSNIQLSANVPGVSVEGGPNA